MYKNIKMLKCVDEVFLWPCTHIYIYSFLFLFFFLLLLVRHSTDSVNYTPAIDKEITI
jgi:hypothetical protein